MTHPIRVFALLSIKKLSGFLHQLHIATESLS